MSKPDDLSQGPFKVSHGKGKNFCNFRSRSKDRKYNREKFDYQKLSFDCVGDLAFWLDLGAKFLRVNKAACIFGGSLQSGLRQEMNCNIGPNYPKEGTSFPVRNPDRRKTPKYESGGIELRVHEQTKLLFKKNRELQEEIAKRKVAEEQIRAVLSEKDLLLMEAQHRLKNNLQFITSLLDLHSDYTTDNRMQNVLVDIQNRIKSMALIHEQIYRSGRVAKIDFKKYIKNLVRHIFDSYGISKRAITAEITGGDCSLCLKSVINCGLITNELISNSLKHGFPNGRRGVIFINLYSQNNNFKMIIGDNGVGFRRNFSFQKITTLGLRLVISLTHQLRGAIKLNRRGRTEFKIVFPEN
jgi:two-component sensor histidine kinase